MLAKLYHCENHTTALFWILQNVFQISFFRCLWPWILLPLCSVQYLSEKKTGMATKSTHQSLFFILKRYYSWFSYGMIEALRKEFLFHEETEHDERLNKYKTDFNGYCGYRIFWKACFQSPIVKALCHSFWKLKMILKCIIWSVLKSFGYLCQKFIVHVANMWCDWWMCHSCIQIPSWLGDVITITCDQWAAA